MEFEVNEQGVQQLIQDMQSDMRQAFAIASSIDSSTNLLRSALGEDYESIAKTVRAMIAELNQAENELRIISHDMEEYINRVHRARVALN